MALPIHGVTLMIQIFQTQVAQGNVPGLQSLIIHGHQQNVTMINIKQWCFVRLQVRTELNPK